MGLGLHGGGAASARFFAAAEARVTVTDLRDASVLKDSIGLLDGLDIEYVLGRHRFEDFESADIVIKNPGVPRDSQYLKRAQRVETDISVFLDFVKNPLVAVTGSKGKSTTASAVHFVLEALHSEAYLGGNITVSPLTFLPEILEKPQAPVILELSSWQLADLRECASFRPRIAVITNILADHQNYYGSLDEYAADKAVVFKNQGAADFTVLNYDDDFGRVFGRNTKASIIYVSSKPLPDGIRGGWLRDRRGFYGDNGKVYDLIPEKIRLQGEHNRKNLLFAAVVLHLLGIDPAASNGLIGTFAGIPHRLEFLGTYHGVEFYNDSAATIPEATREAVRSFKIPVHLLCGGTDKNCDIDVFTDFARVPKTITLLDGTATERIMSLLKHLNREYRGPYNNLKDAFDSICAAADPGDIVLFSPGCASFGMFLNEFDRGNRFKDLLRRCTETVPAARKTPAETVRYPAGI